MYKKITKFKKNFWKILWIIGLEFQIFINFLNEFKLFLSMFYSKEINYKTVNKVIKILKNHSYIPQVKKY